MHSQRALEHTRLLSTVEHVGPLAFIGRQRSSRWAGHATMQDRQTQRTAPASLRNATLCSSVGTSGPCTDLAAYSSNLRYLSQVLPVGWKLNAVVKYDGYGHGLKEVATVAARLNHSISVMHPEDIAAAATVSPRPDILRIKPASYSEALAAAHAGLRIQETATPSNIQELLAAGRDSNRSIPVHLYMYKYYSKTQGWEFANATQLQQLVASLDKRYVTVRGIMMHAEGYDNKQAMAWRFLQVACPVAASLAPQRIAVHWMSSSSLLELLTLVTNTKNNATAAAASRSRLRLNLPPACVVPNIEFWARVGSAAYGMFTESNAQLPGVRPVLCWTSRVTRVGQTTIDGSTVPVAVVDVSPARFPAPSWWNNAAALAQSTAVVTAADSSYDSSNDESSAGDKTTQPHPWRPSPELFVFIKGQKMQLAAPPAGNGSMFLVDTSGASSAVQVGDAACLLCEQQPAGDLGQQLGADAYNTALCLRGRTPVAGATLFKELPNCTPARV